MAGLDLLKKLPKMKRPFFFRVEAGPLGTGTVRLSLMRERLGGSETKIFIDVEKFGITEDIVAMHAFDLVKQYDGYDVPKGLYGDYYPNGD